VELDPELLDPVIREFVDRIDYDVYKRFACNEETGEDTFPELVRVFISIYEAELGSKSE
jgi:hypothetical protein